MPDFALLIKTKSPGRPDSSTVHAPFDRNGAKIACKRGVCAKDIGTELRRGSAGRPEGVAQQGSIETSRLDARLT